MQHKNVLEGFENGPDHTGGPAPISTVTASGLYLPARIRALADVPGAIASERREPRAHFLFAPRAVFEFKRRNPKVSSDGDVGCPPRFFPDGIAALRYACKFLQCPLHEGAFLPAVVLDPHELFGTQATVKTDEDGNQLAFLCVASEDGGFFVAASTAGPKGPRLEPGQLVAWKPVRHVPDIADNVSDERFGWVGVIVGTLKPEHRDGCWVGTEIFRPSSPRAS